MADDEFDFSDDDFDDLPANTLDHLEARAFEATQHQANTARGPESDYGLDDGDQVVNLDHLPQYTQPQPQPQPDYAYHDDNDDDDHDHDYGNHEDGDANSDQQLYHHGMQVQEPPGPSQHDPTQLLQRIKKVRHCPHPPQHTKDLTNPRSWSKTRRASGGKPRSSR